MNSFLYTGSKAKPARQVRQKGLCGEHRRHQQPMCVTAKCKWLQSPLLVLLKTLIAFYHYNTVIKSDRVKYWQSHDENPVAFHHYNSHHMLCNIGANRDPGFATPDWIVQILARTYGSWIPDSRSDYWLAAGLWYSNSRWLLNCSLENRRGSKRRRRAFPLPTFWSHFTTHI